MSTRLRWALAVSLGLNLFLLGYGGTRLLRRSSPLAAPHGELAALDERPGHGLGRLLGPPTPELRGQHEALREARRAVASALEAEPFDAKELERALAELRASTGRGQELLHQRLVDKVGQLSPEERAKLSRARFLREPRGEGPATQRGPGAR